MTNFQLITNHPVAQSSIDHLFPHGTMQDDSRSPAFNSKLAELMAWIHGSEYKPRLLDIGCAGGGMVEDFYDMGWDAIGIEGSDYSKNLARASWGTIPDRLFTCDATKEFAIIAVEGIPDGDHVVPLEHFDVITAWEFLEHIALGKDLDTLAMNIISHLRPGGLFICSVANYSYMHEGQQYHPTVRPFDWWWGCMEAYGFVRQTEMEDNFNPDAWVRHSNNTVNDYGDGSKCFVFQAPGEVE